MLLSPPAGALLGGTVPDGIGFSAGRGGAPPAPGFGSGWDSATGLVAAAGGARWVEVASGFASASRGAVVGSPGGGRSEVAAAARPPAPRVLVIAPVAPKTARHETAIRSTPSATR